MLSISIFISIATKQEPPDITTMIQSTRFQSSCASLLLVFAASHVEALSACGCDCECKGFLCFAAKAKIPACSTFAAYNGQACSALEPTINDQAKAAGVRVQNCKGTVVSNKRRLGDSRIGFIRNFRDGEALRGPANPANDTGVAAPGRMLFGSSEPNNGFPFPRYDNGCLPEQYKDKCESCMCIEGGIGNAVQTKRCNIEAIPDGSGNNGCYDKVENGGECGHSWDCISNFCMAKGLSRNYHCWTTFEGP